MALLRSPFVFGVFRIVVFSHYSVVLLMRSACSLSVS